MLNKTYSIALSAPYRVFPNVGKMPEVAGDI